MRCQFGRASLTRFNTLHPKLRSVMMAAISETPVDFTIVCGHRNEEDQMEAYNYRGPNEERKSYAKFGESPHNYEPSLAVDIAPYAKGKIQWRDDFLWDLLVKHVFSTASDMDIQLTWGADWDRDGDTTDQKWHDMPHFELTGWKDMI